jgi:hypothetical protein
MTPRNPVIRLAVPLAAVASLSMLGSCGIFGIASKVGEAIEAEKKIEVLAKYRGLENKTVAVVVNADRGTLYDFPTVVPQVAFNIAMGIQQHVSGAKVMSYRESLAWCYKTPSWTTLPLGQVVDDLGVERVVYVDLYEFRLNPPGNRWLWEGMAGANIMILEKESLDPDAAAETYEMVVRFPDQKDLSRESAREADVQLGLVARFTQSVSKLFYDHMEDKYPDKKINPR